MQHLEDRLARGEEGVDGTLLFAPALTNMKRLGNIAKKVTREALQEVQEAKVQQFRREQVQLLGEEEAFYIKMDMSLRELKLIQEKQFPHSQRHFFP